MWASGREGTAIQRGAGSGTIFGRFDMNLLEASVPGTLRMILWLLAAWWVVRMFMRYSARNRTANGPQRTNEVPRPKGEVRIEKVPPPDKNTSTTNGTITDADFEEIK